MTFPDTSAQAELPYKRLFAWGTKKSALINARTLTVHELKLYTALADLSEADEIASLDNDDEDEEEQEEDDGNAEEEQEAVVKEEKGVAGK